MNKKYRLNEARRINRILAEEKQRFLNEVNNMGIETEDYEGQPMDGELEEPENYGYGQGPMGDDNSEEPMGFDGYDEYDTDGQQPREDLWELDQLPELAAANPEAQDVSTEQQEPMNEWSYERDVLGINPERERMLNESWNQDKLLTRIKAHWNSNATRLIK